jgi:D-alanine-D-alanine ligase
MLQFPELVLTQIVAIVMVSEYLDLRLLQDWDLRVARALLPAARPARGPLPVAVVRNRVEPDAGDGTQHGVARPRALRSVGKIVDALEAGGHPVRVIEGDASLLRELRRFFPRTPTDGEPFGIVLNLAHGESGGARATHVPALLELAGVAYAGPDPLGHAIASDRLALKLHLREGGVATPEFRVIADPRDGAGGLRYPAVVRPRYIGDARPLVVRDRRQLRAAVRRLTRRHDQETVVEERVAGRRVRVALLGNDPVECLPLVELDSKGRLKICPARLEEALAGRIREVARASFRACGCRDYALVDVRVADSGEVLVVGVETLGILAGGGSFALAGIEAGYTFPRLVCRIVEIDRAARNAPSRRERPRATAPARNEA